MTGGTLTSLLPQSRTPSEFGYSTSQSDLSPETPVKQHRGHKTPRRAQARLGHCLLYVEHQPVRISGHVSVSAGSVNGQYQGVFAGLE